MVGFWCERWTLFGWKQLIKVKNILMMDLFLTNTKRLFGVVWITCGLLWCFSAVWTLILTAPIHCRASIAWDTDVTLHFSKSDEETTHLHLGWPDSECVFISGWTIPFTFAWMLIIWSIWNLDSHAMKLI